MSTIASKALHERGAGIDINKWNRLVADSPKRIRRSVSIRLASANRALASLRHSERAERQMLQVAREKLQNDSGHAATDDAGRVSQATAELRLEVETHISNLKAIEQQIALVRLAIEHLHRRSAGWSAKTAGRNEGPSRSNGVSTAGDEHLALGFAAVRAIRRLRAVKLAAGANV